MILSFVELDVLIELTHLAVDTCTQKAVAMQFVQLLLELAFPAANDRRKDHHAFALRKVEYAGDDLIDGLTRYRSSALRTVRLADRRKKQTQKIVNFRYRADRRTR